MQSLSIELKGLILATAAVVALLGLIFGISPLIGADQTKAIGKLAPDSQWRAVPGTPSVPQNADPNARLVEGHQFYLKSCTVCHGSNALGVIGPSLRNLSLNDAQIEAVIKTGVKDQMPAFATVYDDNGIQAMAAYIRSIQNPAEKAAPPGASHSTPESPDEGRF